MKEVVTFVGTALKAASGGFELTAQPLKCERLAICSGCADFDQTTNKCRVCGCNMEVKASFKSLSCPSGKW